MLGRPTKKQALFRSALLRREKPLVRRPALQSEKKWMSFGALLLWILFLGTMVYSLLFSPWLDIVALEIEGESVIPRQTIETLIEEELAKKSLFIFPRRNLLLAPMDHLEERLFQEYPKFESVRIERIFPHTLRVTLREQPFLIRWCSGGPCFLLGNDGRARSAEEALNPLYTPSLFTIVDKSAFPVNLGAPLDITSYEDTLSRFATLLPLETGLSLDRFSETPMRYAEELRLRTTEGWDILISTKTPAEESVEIVRLLLQTEIFPDKRANLLSVDLRTKGRVFLGLKLGKEEVSIPEKTDDVKEVPKKKKE